MRVGMISRLHPLVKFAVLFVLAEFFLAALTQQFYQWLTTKWQPAMPDFIPPGVFVGVAFGLVGACIT